MGGGGGGAGSKYLGGSSRGKCLEVRGPGMAESPLWAPLKAEGCGWGGKDSRLRVSRGSVMREEMLSVG